MGWKFPNVAATVLTGGVAIESHLARAAIVQLFWIFRADTYSSGHRLYLSRNGCPGWDGTRAEVNFEGLGGRKLSRIRGRAKGHSSCPSFGKTWRQFREPRTDF